MDMEAVSKKWADYLQLAYEVKAGLRPRPPLIIIKYRLDGSISELPPA